VSKSVTSVRWTLHAAAQEFGIDDKTLAGKIRTGGIVVGDDGKFGTLDICKAVFGDIDGEKLRLVREQADSFAIKNAASRGQLLPVEDVKKHFEGVLIALRAGILASNLEQDEKSELLLNLKRLGESVKINESNRNSVAPVVEDYDSATGADREPVGE
jgi:hypothetical protein